MRLRRRAVAPEPGLLLARSVCHELRPSMSTLVALLRAMEDAPTAPRHAELARLAAEHAKYAQAVLDEAAATAMGLAGEAVPPVPLRAVLPAVASTAPRGALAVRASRAALSWPVHPRDTQQILVNLVTNAVRHAPGPVRLHAGVRARRLRLAVCDRGGPTPALDTALRRSTPPPDDNGLGLWVVRQRLTSLGGTIRARPLAPVGLAMEAVLPRHRP